MSLVDTVLTTASAIAAPLGFAVSYYFVKEQRKTSYQLEQDVERMINTRVYLKRKREEGFEMRVSPAFLVNENVLTPPVVAPAPAKPPKLADSLLQLLTTHRYQEDILGDLEEGYAKRHAAGRPLFAKCWYWSQAIQSIAASQCGRLVGRLLRWSFFAAAYKVVTDLIHRFPWPN